MGIPSHGNGFKISKFIDVSSNQFTQFPQETSFILRGALAPCRESSFSSRNSFIDVMFIRFTDFNYNFFRGWIIEREFLSTVTIDEFTVDEKSSFNFIMSGHFFREYYGLEMNERRNGWAIIRGGKIIEM
jgi:hypothetical protein